MGGVGSVQASNALGRQVDVPPSFDSVLLPERDRGHMNGLGGEDRDHLFTNDLQFLNFTGVLSPRKSRIEDHCLVFRLYWYTKVTRSDLPPSNFRTYDGTLLPYLSSVPLSQ